MRKSPRRSSKVRGNQSLVGKLSRSNDVVARGEISCQVHQEQVEEQRHLGLDGSETTVRVRNPDPHGPRLGDRHETSCKCDQKNGTVVFEDRQRDGKSEKSGVLVPGGREQFQSRRCFFVVRDPKNPDEPEEQGRNTPVTAIHIVKGTNVCKGHRSGKHCRRRFRGDNDTSVGSSCGKNGLDQMQ